MRALSCGGEKRQLEWQVEETYKAPVEVAVRTTCEGFLGKLVSGVKKSKQNFISKKIKSAKMQQSTTSFNTTSDFECFQNFTSPEIFVQQLAGVVNQGDISCIIKSQKQM